MNRHDKRFIMVLFLVSLVMMIGLALTKKDGKQALVYYEDTLVKTILLDQDGEYSVMGANGPVVIQVKNGKLKVEEENSPKHLCSKQGWVSSSYEPIVCLPNKIVIQISATEHLDTVVK